MTKRIFTFDDLKTGIKQTAIINSLKDQGYHFILAVARGGLVPGTLMGYALELPVLSVSYSGTGGNGDTEHNDYFRLPFNKKDKKKFLVVEDICDTGNTLHQLTNYLDILDQEYDTYAFCTRNNNEIQHKPRYSTWTILPEITWVDFPWEN